MGLLSDRGIKARIRLKAGDPNRLRISGFSPKLVKVRGKPSWGLSCAGYDMRLANEFLYIDPLALSQSERPYLEVGQPAPWITVKAPFFILPPGGFVLARTMEYVRVPRDCSGTVYGKSSFARLAICLNTTLIECEWEGTITLEISNIGNFPVKLTAGHGICQVVFNRFDDPTGAGAVETSYADRGSATYQGQTGVTVSRV